MNFGKIDKVILFGRISFLYKFALSLLNKKFEVVFITSERHFKELDDQPDIPVLLTTNQIRCIVSDSIYDSRVIDEISPTTLGISMGAAWIFKEDFISLFGGKLVNCHGTRLPQNRGGGGFSWRILRDDRLGASLIHLIDPGIDTGEIIKYSEYLYPASCRKPIDYENFSLNHYLLFLEEFIDDIITGKSFTPIPQQETFSTHFPRLHTDTHAFIDWNWKLRDIESFICAFDDPYNGAISFLDGKQLRLKDCQATAIDGKFHPYQSGIVYRITNYGIFVAANEGSLIIKIILDEAGNDYLPKIRIADRFYTPIHHLEAARSLRAIYTPQGLKKI